MLEVAGVWKDQRKVEMRKLMDANERAVNVAVKAVEEVRKVERDDLVSDLLGDFIEMLKEENRRMEVLWMRMKAGGRSPSDMLKRPEYSALVREGSGKS